MIHQANAVTSGAQNALIVVDRPFLTYTSAERALRV